MNIRKSTFYLLIPIVLLTSCNLLDIIAITGYVSTSNLAKKVKIDPLLFGYWLYDETDLLTGNTKSILQITKKDEVSGNVTFLSNKEGEKDVTLPCYVADVKGSKFLVVGQGKYFYVRLSYISSNRIDARILNKEIADQVTSDRLQQWLEENIGNNYLINPNANVTMRDNLLRDSEGKKIAIYSDVALKSLTKESALALQKKLLNVEEGAGLLAKTIIPERVVTMNGEKWGYKDVTSGNLAIPAKYDKVQPFRGDYAKVKVGEKWGIIDAKGNKILPCEYDELGPVSDGMIKVGVKSGSSSLKYGFLNLNGDVVLEAKYEQCQDFSEGYGVVYSNYNWFFVNRNGKAAFSNNKVKWFYGEGFKNGFALVDKGENETWRQSDAYGMIDKSGYEIIKCEHGFAGSPKDESAKDFIIFGKIPKQGLVRIKDGRLILPASFATIEYNNELSVFEVYPSIDGVPFYIDKETLKCKEIKGSKCPIDYDPEYGIKIANEIKDQRFNAASSAEDYKTLFLVYSNDDRVKEKMLTTASTIDDYEALLLAYPNDSGIKENLKEYSFFAEADKKFQNGDESQIIEYLNKFPSGKFVPEAKDRLSLREDTKAFNAAKQLYTIEAFENYMNRYPLGKYLIDATKLISEIKEKPDNDAFNQAAKINSVESLSKYLADFPNGIHKTEAEYSINSLNKQEQDYVTNNIEQLMESIGNNILLNTKQGFENGVNESERIMKQERSVDNSRLLVTSAYLVISKWALGDADGARSTYLKYSGNTIAFSNGNTPYPEYFETLYKELKGKITLPDEKANYKKIVKQKLDLNKLLNEN